jgi:hypothetical protein
VILGPRGDIGVLLTAPEEGQGNVYRLLAVPCGCVVYVGQTTRALLDCLSGDLGEIRRLFGWESHKRHRGVTSLRAELVETVELAELEAAVVAEIRMAEAEGWGQVNPTYDLLIDSPRVASARLEACEQAMRPFAGLLGAQSERERVGDAAVRTSLGDFLSPAHARTYGSSSDSWSPKARRGLPRAPYRLVSGDALAFGWLRAHAVVDDTAWELGLEAITTAAEGFGRRTVREVLSSAVVKARGKRDHQPESADLIEWTSVLTGLALSRFAPLGPVWTDELGCVMAEAGGPPCGCRNVTAMRADVHASPRSPEMWSQFRERLEERLDS